MSAQLCDVLACQKLAVSFDDESGFRCEMHASAEAVST